MHSTRYLGLAAAIALTAMVSPSSAQQTVCTEGECVLVPPDMATAPTPGLVIREVRPDDTCYSEGDESWVSPDAVRGRDQPTARPAGPGDVCYSEGDNSWVIPR